MKPRMFFLVTVLAALVSNSPSAVGQTATTIAYQGRLMVTGGVEPVDRFDLRFRLFDTAAGGSQLDESFVQTVTPDTNGLFTVLVDAHPTWSSSRTVQWVELGARRSGGTSNYVTLSPRQRVSPVPAALHAQHADVANAFTGAVSVVQLPAAVARLDAPQTFVAPPTFMPVSGPPFLVGTTQRVANLNADLLDGLDATNFWRWSLVDGVAAGVAPSDLPVEIRIQNTRVLRLERGVTVPNLIGGSFANTITQTVSGAVITGGGGTTSPNSIAANGGFIGAGLNNVINANADHSVVAGGNGNQIATGARESIIGGGGAQRIGSNSIYAGIFAGSANEVMANSPHSVISGGRSNVIDGHSGHTFIGSGLENLIQSNAPFAAVLSGEQNMVCVGARYSLIGGGHRNLSEEGVMYGFVGAGESNVLDVGASYSAILGGSENLIRSNATYAVVLGGQRNTAGARYSLAGGHGAKAEHDGSIVFSAGGTTDFASTGADQFAVRATGGVHFQTAGAGLFVDGQRMTNGSGSATIPDGSVTAAKLADGAALSELLDDDGSGSGLDADRLDGLDSTAFAGATHNHTAADINSGTLSDARLSANVPLLASGSNLFMNANIFAPTGSVTGVTVRKSPAATSSTDIFRVQSADGGSNYFRVSPSGQVSWAGTAAGSVGGDGSGLTSLNAGNITSGLLSEARIDAAVARDNEILPTVLNGDGAGSNLDADLLDGLNSAAFALASHTHDGSAIVSGIVPDARIASTLARDAEILPTVLAGDGPGSGLDGDLLDGLDSTGFWKAGGNAGTLSFLHFLGTTDNQALEFRVNNLRVLRLVPGASPNIIGGHSLNFASAGVYGATISGGGTNGFPHWVSGNYGTIGGGRGNAVNGEGSTVAGGFGNDAIGNDSTVGGGRDNTANPDGSTVAGGGFNDIGVNSDYSAIGGGFNNDIAANAPFATIAGGINNDIGTNSVSSAIGGGTNNNIAANSGYATIAGGAANDIGTNSDNSAIGGGLGNNIAANSQFATIAGGYSNDISTNSDNSAIGGGYNNNIAANALSATIAGGINNDIGTDSDYSAIGGGIDNNIAANSLYATIAGGVDNDIGTNSDRSAIGGGSDNNIAANSGYATIAGGSLNDIGTNSDYSAIGGGIDNNITANSPYATVGGGSYNTARASNSTVAGGLGNIASGEISTVLGGQDNIASGSHSAVPGGWGNIAGGDFSFAAGRRAQANHQGSFAWADSTDYDFASTAANQFRVRAKGGVRIYTGVDGVGDVTVGVSLNPNGNSWNTVSDRAVKKNFAPVDTQAVLEKLAQVPVPQWNYQWEQDGQSPHLGPTAQDFKAAFYPGRDDKTISTLEFDGVALAAIQGLNLKLEGKLKEKEARIQALENTVGELKELVSAFARQK